jgi:hypothetical protein
MMKKLVTRFFVFVGVASHWCLVALFLVFVGVPSLWCKEPRESSIKSQTRQQIVVRIHRAKKGLEFELKSDRLKKDDANYLLAELKLRECSDCQIVVLIDDNIELSAITQISEMAINAGFKDIRPFVYWRNTGKIAEIQFGPVMKLNNNPPTL